MRHSTKLKRRLTQKEEAWVKFQGYDSLVEPKEQGQAFSKFHADFVCKKRCTAELNGALLVDLFRLRETFDNLSHSSLPIFQLSVKELLPSKRSDDDAKALDGKNTSTY